MKDTLFAAVGCVLLGALSLIGLFTILYALVHTYTDVGKEDVKPSIQIEQLHEVR